MNGAGLALKEHDFIAAYCCSACHAVIDGGRSDLSQETVLRYFYEGIFRTQQSLYYQGLLIIQGEKNVRRKK